MWMLLDSGYKDPPRILYLIDNLLIDHIRDLSFNEIDGDIPFSISKLKQLEYL